GLGELAEDGLDRGFAGTERILIAADADTFHSRRKIGTHAARAALAAGLLRFRHQLFVTAGGHESGGVGVLSQSQALKETASRHRLRRSTSRGRSTTLRPVRSSTSRAAPISGSRTPRSSSPAAAPAHCRG